MSIFSQAALHFSIDVEMFWGARDQRDPDASLIRAGEDERIRFGCTVREHDCASANSVYVFRYPWVVTLFSRSFRALREFFGAEICGGIVRLVMLVTRAPCASAVTVAARRNVLVGFAFAVSFSTASLNLIPRLQIRGEVFGWLIAAAITSMVAIAITHRRPLPIEAG